MVFADHLMNEISRIRSFVSQGVANTSLALIEVLNHFKQFGRDDVKKVILIQYYNVVVNNTNKQPFFNVGRY